MFEVVPVVWTKFQPFLDGAAGCPGGGPKAAIQHYFLPNTNVDKNPLDFSHIVEDNYSEPSGA